MSDLNNLFDKETITNISKLVEEKMPELNQVSEFKKCDQNFALALESFENYLSEDLSKKFDDLVNLHYKVLDYYFTLAYFLGIKHGKQIEKL